MDEDGFLDHIEVEEGFQRKKIGLSLIQLAVERLSLRRIACVVNHLAYRHSLSTSGEQLIVACIRNSLIRKEMCEFSGEELLEANAIDPTNQVKSSKMP